MTELQREQLTHLFEMAMKYYTEQYGDNEGTLSIPEHQPEKQFIQEVFVVLGDVLEVWDKDVVQ